MSSTSQSSGNKRKRELSPEDPVKRQRTAGPVIVYVPDREFTGQDQQTKKPDSNTSKSTSGEASDKSTFDPEVAKHDSPSTSTTNESTQQVREDTSMPVDVGRTERKETQEKC